MEDDIEEREGPEGWKDPVHCPRCGSDSVRLVEMRYERALYECELCRAQFEEG